MGLVCLDLGLDLGLVCLDLGPDLSLVYLDLGPDFGLVCLDLGLVFWTWTNFRATNIAAALTLHVKSKKSRTSCHECGNIS